MFPNRFNVYLHDTPTDRLFNASARAFSHGCIRLEKPIDLANAVLADNPKWTPDAVQDALLTGESTTVSLRERLPVHIYYLTAWVDESGTVQFRRDVYGYDAKVAAALARESLLAFDFNLGRGQLRAEMAPPAP
jgi:murein L,D-transpeptidase YcbB/YkuD